MNIRKSNCFKWSATIAVAIIVAYIITWRFYAMWWFIIAFFDLVIFLVYIVVLFVSIIWGLGNLKNYHYPFLPLCINMLAALIILVSPSPYRNKNYYKRTTVINDKHNSCARRLYIETYCVYGGGALSTDLNAAYLTDSVSFRKYMGVYDEGPEMIIINCKGDSILTQKITNESSIPEWGGRKILEKASFSLETLMRANTFE